MGCIPRFYQSESDFEQIHSKLSLYQCPHCFCLGFLILHGYLYGYRDTNFLEPRRTGHRIYCSNRYRKEGCGKTVMLVLAIHITGSSYSANVLWQFLSSLSKTNSISSSHRDLNSPCTISWAFHSYRRFERQIIDIREALLQLTEIPVHESNDPVLVTLTHLAACFPGVPNPIEAFQLQTGADFI